MEQELLKKIEQEFSQNLEKIIELDKESDTVGKKRIMSQFFTMALFGAIPAIIMTLISAKLITAGILSTGIATAVSCVTTTLISLLNYKLYQNKFDFYNSFQKYNVTGSEKELTEREYELVEQKKLLEIKNRALKSLHHSISTGEIALVNPESSAEKLDQDLETATRRLEEIGKISYVHDCFFEFEQKTKSKFRSFINGFAMGSIMSLAMLSAPSLIAGTSSYIWQLITSALTVITGVTFGSVAAYNTGNLEDIYDEKKSEVAAYQPPSDNGIYANKVEHLIKAAIKDYAVARTRKECENLPVVPSGETIDLASEQTLKPPTVTKDNPVILAKKY